MQILTGRKLKPRRIMNYGIHGCGKSTWASEAPGCIFIDIEDGLNDIDCAKTPRCNDYGNVLSAVSWLLTEKHDYKWVAVDTLDWMQALIFAKVSQDAGVSSIEKIAYGKGYEAAVKCWDYVLKGFDALRDNRGMGIILLAHARIAKFASPETDSYDRYEPDLHKAVNGMIQEWCDEVFFSSYRVFTRSEDLGFNKVRQIAVGGKDRFIRTNASAVAEAKNRLRLPDELPMEWSAYAQYLPQSGSTTPLPPAPAVAGPASADGNISGVVNNGSSKKEG